MLCTVVHTAGAGAGAAAADDDDDDFVEGFFGFLVDGTVYIDFYQYASSVLWKRNYLASISTLCSFELFNCV